MTKKKRSILLAVMTLMLALSLVAGGTYALFTDTVVQKTHLQAGKLNVTLLRTSLLTESLDTNTGFLKETENPEDIDFSDPADPNDPNAKNKNIFDITDDTLIVPGCWYSAEMQIINNSDVAFGYWIEVVFDDKDDLALADQINVKITTPNGSIDKRLSQSAGFIGSEDSPIGVLAKSGNQLFTVRVDFVDLKDGVNNDAASQSVKFDIVVHAVQVTEAK